MQTCSVLSLLIAFGLSLDVMADDFAAPTGSSSILAEDSQLEEIWNEGQFTEGVAVAPDGRVYFSDISRDDRPGRILRFDQQTGQTDVFCSDSGQSNGLMFDRQGNLIAACGANGGKMALCKIATDGTVTELVSRYDGKRLNSPNDLVIHPDGSIYFSDPRYMGHEPIELDLMSVYRFDPKTKMLTRVTKKVSKPNGVMLSPDGSRLYVAETDNGSRNGPPAEGEKVEVRMTLNAFPVESNGSLGKRQILHDFGDQLGVDGMTVDLKGNIYAAVRSEKRFGIVVFDPGGTEVAYLPTPDLPTNCCFGRGAQKNVLYITAGTGLYRIALKSEGAHPATSPRS